MNPRSSKDELVDLNEKPIRVKLTAPPVDGEANRALIHLIARAVKIPKNDVEIVAGRRSRLKTVKIRGIGALEVVNRLNHVARS